MALAADKPADKSSAAAAREPVVKVLEIKGKARFRTGPEAPWQTLTLEYRR